MLAKFMFGQGLIQTTNLITGLVIVWLLPIEQYALYIVIMMLTSVATVASDFGVGQAINTFAAKHHTDAQAVTSIYSAGRHYRRIMVLIAVPATIALAIYMTASFGLSSGEIGALLLMMAALPLLQAHIALRGAVMNAYHDSRGLFTAGVAGAVTRLLLAGICFVWPHALAATALTLVGTMVNAAVLQTVSARYLTVVNRATTEWKRAVRRFVVPLMPGVAYYLVQGHIGTFVLTVHAQTTALAEVGALGRLGQIIAFLTPILPFFVQPHFARIVGIAEFRRKAVQVILLVLSLAAVVIGSGYLLPEAWLLILGSKYQHLSREVPVALAFSVASFFAATLFHIVIARQFTRNQTWPIIIGISLQAAFVYLHGVRSTMDALIVTFIPNVPLILGHLLNLWIVSRKWTAAS